MELLELLRQRVERPGEANDSGVAIKGSEPLPPVTDTLVLAAERQLGFELPRLLRDIYCTVANGGIGPGYGLFRLHDEPQTGDLVETYHYMADDDPSDPEWQWPRGLLPVFSHGCGMYECVDCLQELAPVIWHNPDYLVGRSVPSTLAPLTDTLEHRLMGWIRGENPIDAANQSLNARHKR